MNHLPTEKLPLLPQAPKLQLNPLIVTLTIIPQVIPRLVRNQVFLTLSLSISAFLVHGDYVISCLLGAKLRYCEKATIFFKLSRN